MKNWLKIFPAVAILSGCLGEQQIDLPSGDPRIVVDGLITNREGESYIIIGWSDPVAGSCQDIYGDVTTCIPRSFEGPYNVTGLVRIIENGSEIKSEISLQMDEKKGMVLLKPDFVSTTGYQYRLEIEIVYNGITEFYSASTTMLSTPTISNISYEIRKGDIGKNDNMVPLISFVDPIDRNFYLFQLCGIYHNSITCGNSRVWSYSLIADTFLPADVDRLSIDDGVSIAKYAEFYPTPEPGAGVQVKMYSVDQVTYSFYKSLIDQFNNDGGAYSPTPATPKGNISGEGIGIFRAVEESSAIVYY